ncbi:unnamed protein product [Acanthoscelides obtectus]|uniref:Uncharacterized protein n=1 Tax=Acanthoscelides obtectus TaxID=200917 RepID=A0A9P0KJX4_ACAOB|nr:unnamed protein product [Acanthoscelides obtectus]CAK1685435.1 hypothetical protein AOBTE_LOCUS35396 [Acanthoscelides obtectus]
MFTTITSNFKTHTHPTVCLRFSARISCILLGFSHNFVAHSSRNEFAVSPFHQCCQFIDHEITEVQHGFGFTL